MRSHAHDECLRAQLACVRAQLLDLRQKNGGFYAEFGRYPLRDGKIAVPLHRQKETKDIFNSLNRHKVLVVW